jgi:hypothetical protein
MPAWPPGAFTSGLPVHQVTLKTAGYDYGVTRERTPAGLSPASPSASFAALPPQGPPGRVPLLPRYYQSATTSCRPSRRTSLPSLGGTSVALGEFAAGKCCRRRAWGWSPGIPGREFFHGDDRISHVPGHTDSFVTKCHGSPLGVSPREEQRTGRLTFGLRFGNCQSGGYGPTGAAPAK